MKYIATALALLLSGAAHGESYECTVREDQPEQQRIYILEHIKDGIDHGVIMDGYTSPSLAHAAALRHAQHAFKQAGPGASLEYSMADTVALWQDGARIEQWIYWPLDLDKLPY